ncbi:GNAT family N-acetyltransferase [Ruficoccus amylovorans]|uniref:GNAT family N-acetyltransferase n=1 Tax=Ruficoccus amylovorans TaxID=1804625 RepID=A0A842HBF9_9BACT|nr:GNAT family N-acetyltransferase [Ruficoccus amylovorans]MBC2593610.1 GNAT family N-acetyltransferase [Ruficoccus amylovorans]
MDTMVDIRRLRMEELPRVEELARRIWPECFGGLLSSEQIAAMLDAIYAREVLERDGREKGHCFWLAQVDGADSGFVAAYREAETLWIRKLYVLERCRGLGIGKKLIAAARAHFCEVRSLALNVNVANEKAIAFYRSQGFVAAERVSVTMGPYEFEDFVMRREIADK